MNARAWFYGQSFNGRISTESSRESLGRDVTSAVMFDAPTQHHQTKDGGQPGETGTHAPCKKCQRSGFICATCKRDWVSCATTSFRPSSQTNHEWEAEKCPECKGHGEIAEVRDAAA